MNRCAPPLEHHGSRDPNGIASLPAMLRPRAPAALVRLLLLLLLLLSPSAPGGPLPDAWMDLIKMKTAEDQASHRTFGARVKQLFDSYDADGDGVLLGSELQTMLIDYEADGPPTDKLDKIMANMGHAQTVQVLGSIGGLTFNEFEKSWAPQAPTQTYTEPEVRPQHPGDLAEPQRRTRGKVAELLGPLKGRLRHYSADGDVTAVGKALEAGADVNGQSASGRSALMLAALNGHVGVVKALIEAGADVGLQADGGATALMLAVRMGRTTIVRLLLASGAGPNVGNRRGETALMLAAHFDRLDCAKVLLGMDAVDNKNPLTAETKEGTVSLGDLAKKWGVSAIDQRNEDGETALMAAVEKGHDSMIATLLRANADLGARRKTDGLNVIDICRLAGQGEIAQHLQKIWEGHQKLLRRGETTGLDKRFIWASDEAEHQDRVDPRGLMLTALETPRTTWKETLVDVKPAPVKEEAAAVARPEPKREPVEPAPHGPPLRHASAASQKSEPPKTCGSSPNPLEALPSSLLNQGDADAAAEQLRNPPPPRMKYEGMVPLWAYDYMLFSMFPLSAVFVLCGFYMDSRQAAQEEKEAKDAELERVKGAEEQRCTCSICLEGFQETAAKMPRNMDCGHTFCQGCLELMLVKLPREAKATHKTLPCPTCREDTRVPNGKAEQLVKNFLALG